MSDVRIHIPAPAAPHLPRKTRKALSPERWMGIWFVIAAVFWAFVWLIVKH